MAVSPHRQASRMASWMNMYCSWRRIIQHIHIIAKAHIFHFYIKPLTKSTTHTVCNIDNTNSCEHADGQREREVTDGKWRYEWDEMTTVEFLVHFTSGTRYFWIFGSSKWTDREWTEGCCGEWIRIRIPLMSCRRANLCDLLSDRKHEFVFQFKLLLRTKNHSVEANAVPNKE